MIIFISVPDGHGPRLTVLRLGDVEGGRGTRGAGPLGDIEGGRGTRGAGSRDTPRV